MAVRGGDKFAAELQRMAGAVNSAQSVKVGFLSNSSYPDGTPVALIAAIQNWGAPSRGIPPRPFFSDMIRKHQAEWGPLTGALLKANNYDAGKTLDKLGEEVVGELRESITETNDPPLAESTLRKRGVGGMVYNPSDKRTFGAKPLIATGWMFNSADYAVKGK